MKDIDVYLAELRRAGYVIVRARRRNHLKVSTTDGALVAVISSTTKSRNAVNDLRTEVRRFERKAEA